MILATLLGTVVGLNPGVCGGTYVIDATAPTGTIDWPGSGADYSPSASVCWRIQGGSSYVHLDWTRLMIEDHALCVATHPCATGMCPYNGGVLCSHDALTVYDSSTSHRICGTDGSLPDWQPTVAGDIVLHFSSNTVIHSTGFALTWRHCAIPGIAFTVNPPQCAHVYHDYFSTPTGTLKYPSSGNYNEGERKCWRILCNGQLSISWLSVSTEPVHGCFWDYVALYDSSGEEKRVCQPPGTIYYHPGDVVIHLHSDLCTGDAGFELSWSCGAWAYPTTPAAGTLAVPSCSMYKSDFMSSGSLTYPASGTYENSQNVCWRIQCATQVHLTYSFIDIGESTDGRCTMDFLLFAMQGSIYSPNFCGTTVPTYQPSVRGDVVIIFTSGNEVPRTGFGLSWTCDSSAEPPSPSAPSVVFQATAVPSSNACFDVTPSPPTPIPSTPSPPTPFPQTASPPTPNPPTPFPPTPSPPTPFPPTSSPPTPFPPTPSPLTLSPPTPSPPTPFPPTPSPLTPFPPTASPPTPAPSTPFPQTASPPTPSPLTLSPLTPFPQTASPPTSVPLTPNPLTPFPPTASPSTPSPPTPFPPTPNPLTPLPSTLAPSTPFPQTASPSTPSPPTPFPQTASPLTPVPLTPNPLTPFPPTPNPLTPLPPTASPSTASPLTLNPPTPIPITPNPPTLSPLTPFPQTASPLTPVPPTSIPLTSSPLIFFPPTASPLTASPPTPIPLTSSPLTLFPSTASPSTGAPLTSIPPTANPPIPSTSSPLTPAPSTSSPLTLPPLVLSTSAPLTPSPLTLTPLSPSPSTQSPPTVSPLTPVPQTPNPTTSSPPTPFPPSPVPQTHSPLTASPSTLVPLTQAPAQIQTPSPTFTSTAVPSTLSPLTFTPVTHAPLTLIPTFSPTLSPPTPSPHTQVPPTGIPLTPTLTPPNSTTSPQTPNPVTSVPPTSSPLTPFPLTGSPLTPFPQTGSPLTPIPLTGSPLTPIPLTGSPLTPFPLTGFPQTGSPLTPFPLTGSPLTPIPLTGSPLTPFPLTGFPQTGSPLTPFPLTGSPLTPIPLTGSPLTPFPLTGFPQTGSPLAPFPLTGSPLTPIPLTGSPLTPIPLTGSPLTPIPLTGSPLTPIPLTGSPLTPFPLTGSPLTLTPSTPSPLTAAPLLPTAVPSEAPCFCVHGTCMSGLCNCHTNPVLGYWDGVACNDCKQGWWGRTCTKQCEGGACDPCGGHGQCDGGVGGTGSCSCFSDTVRGHWTGRACGVCRDRWGGARCRLRCPDCSGHGACSNGQCLCDKGYENASNCLTCTSGWSIDRSGFCKSECLGGTAVGLPCSGHGQCTNGLCICDSDYWGVDCSGECKCSNAVCDPLTGKCKCKQHYAEPDCIQCEMGYGGSSCQQKCLCSGHGTCDDAGTCTCSSHWTGDHCDLLCPGIHAPCNNHGVCSTVNGKAHCTCDASPDLGFWLGSDCSTCQSNWWGSMCKLTCPGCGTVGACYPIGKCGCAKRPKVTNDYCGDTCSLKCDSCSDPLRLGATCNRVCPGYPIECSGHGNCDAGVRGTGDCWCSYGWAGAACDLQCPVSFGQPCGGPIRGICEASGTCTCLRNWYGVSCDATCHVEQGVVCSGHGECAADTPTCVCGPGWQGPTCDVECPCGKYGLCTVGGGCECIGNFKFHGGTCSACLAGYAGDRCDLLCVNGQTSTGGTRCLCDSYYSGVSCDSKCPESSSGICNSHGTCIHGSQYPASSCKCSLDWYGKTCDVMCVAERCVAQGLQHAQCGVNGECVCQDNAGGHWTGTQCDSCKDQWWGIDCDMACECSGHGSCNPNTGVCKCYSSKASGFFQGPRCSVCQDGYLGAGCNQLEVPPTRIDLHLPIKKPVFMATDEEHSRLYVGFTSSVAEYQTYPWPPREVRSAVVNNAVGVWFSGGTGYILEQRNNTKHEILSFERRVGLIHISKKGEAQLQEHVVNVCAREGLVVTKDCNLWGMRGQSLEVKSSGVMQGCEYASCDGGKVTLCSEAACNEVDPTTGVASAVKISGRVAAVDKGAVLSCGAAAWVYHNGMGFLVSSNGWCAAAALTVDAANAAAYVFIQNEPSRPATVYKVRLGPDGGYYGRLTLNSILTTNAVNHEYVTITALDNSLRVIFSAGDHMGLSAFTLHEVSAIIPPVADNRGGTSLTIVLKGAENMTKFVEPYTCSFLEGGNVSDAEWLRSSMVTCDTKEVLQPSCEGDYVEIGMSSRYAISTESLRRYVPPMLKTVNNRYGLASTPTVITVTGTGFKKVPSAMCVFSDGSEHRLYRDAGIETQAAVVLPCTTTRKCRYAKRESVTAIHVPATVLDTATVLCTQPAIDTSLSVLSHIDVALDGQIYTGGALQYDILLKGAGIEAPDVYRAVVGSTPEPLRVYTVDGGRRSLEGATEGVENCTAEYVWNDTLVVLDVFEIRGGVGVVHDVLVWDILKGMEGGSVHTFEVTFKVAGTPWSDKTTFHIKQGPAKNIVFKVPCNTHPIPGQVFDPVVVGIVDALGNKVGTSGNIAKGTWLEVNGTRVALETITRVVVDGIATFDHMQPSLKSGFDYIFQVTLPNQPAIPPLLSPIVSVSDCIKTLYHIAGDVGCFPCPEGGQCNGSIYIIPQEGWWSPEVGANVFYRCRSDAVCLGGAASAAEEQCAEGSKGALCQGCNEGWARERAVNKPCLKCTSGDTTLAYLVIVGMLLVGCVLICGTLRSYRKNGTLGHRMVVIRTCIIWMQSLGKFYEYNNGFTEPIDSTLFWFSRASLFDVSLYRPFNCLAKTYFPVLEVYMLFPVTATVLATAVYLLLSVLPRKGERAIGELTFKLILGVSMTVSFVSCYPTMLTHYLAYQKCENFGDGHSPLWVDSSIDCTSAEYKVRKVIAAAMAYFTGAVLPIAFIFACKWLRGRDAHHWLMYLTGGFKNRYWYWIVVVLAREAALVAPALYATEWEDRTTQHYLAMYTMEISLVLQYYFMPFDVHLHNIIECASLAVNCVVVNLLLLTYIHDFEGVVKSIMMYVLSILCFGMLLAFLFAMLPDPVRWEVERRVSSLWRGSEMEFKLSVDTVPLATPLDLSLPEIQYDTVQRPVSYRRESCSMVSTASLDTSLSVPNRNSMSLSSPPLFFLDPPNRSRRHSVGNRSRRSTLPPLMFTPPDASLGSPTPSASSQVSQFQI